MELIVKKAAGIQSGAGAAVSDVPDRVAYYAVDAVGTTQSSTLTPYIGVDAYRTIAVCRRVDSSNYAVQLGIPAFLGQIAEVYADGGNIEVFLWQGTFLDGGTSQVVTKGARFVCVKHPSDYLTWARAD